MKKFILVMVGATMVLMACDAAEVPEESVLAPVKQEEAEPEAEVVEELSIGDSAEVAGVKMTLQAVTSTEERNEFDESDPAIVVKIEYELENNSEDDIPIGMDLQVYDGTGNQVESYALDNTLGSLKPGKKIQAVEHYGIEEGPIEIYFQPMLSMEKAAIFNAEVK